MSDSEKISQIKNCYEYFNGNIPNWRRIQNANDDKRMNNWLFDTWNFQEVSKKIINEYNGDERDYAFRRWFNHKCSVIDESIFAQNGCTPNPNQYDKSWDFELPDGRRFDLKGTKLPNNLRDWRFKIINNELSESDYCSLAQYMYQSQSGRDNKDGRYGAQNRLFMLHIAKYYKNDDSIRIRFDEKASLIGEFLNQPVINTYKFEFDGNIVSSILLLILENDNHLTWMNP